MECKTGKVPNIYILFVCVTLFLTVHPNTDQLVQRRSCVSSLAEKTGVHNITLCTFVAYWFRNATFPLSRQTYATLTKRINNSVHLYTQQIHCVFNKFFEPSQQAQPKSAASFPLFTPIYRRKDIADYFLKRSSECFHFCIFPS